MVDQVRTTFGGVAGNADLVVLGGNSGATQATAPFSKPASAANVAGGNPTYRACGVGYAAYATPTDLLTISGSDTKTIIVTALNIAPGATATAPGAFYWVKRSAANTGGTSTNPAAIPFDSADPAATAVLRLYSAIPSALGAAVGNVAIVNASVTISTSAPAVFGYAGSTTNGAPVAANSIIDVRKPIVLRGAGEILALNFNGAAIPAGFTAGWAVEWIEI